MLGLLPLWVVLVVALWACAPRAFREVRRESDTEQRAILTGALLLAVIPPSAVLLVSGFVLLQAQPTVQFNVGSPRALEVWSFWVRWWPAILGFSFLQTIAYLLWFIEAVVTRPESSLAHVVGLACLSSLFGSLLVYLAHPSA
jgi:hypothetical protein